MWVYYWDFCPFALNLYFCFCPSTILFVWLYLCSIVCFDKDLRFLLPRIIEYYCRGLSMREMRANAFQHDEQNTLQASSECSSQHQPSLQNGKFLILTPDTESKLSRNEAQNSFLTISLVDSHHSLRTTGFGKTVLTACWNHLNRFKKMMPVWAPKSNVWFSWSGCSLGIRIVFPVP